MNKYIAIIPARAGSKELKSKNKLLFNSKPLIHWTIISAIKSKYIDKVIITSNDRYILNMKNNYENDKLMFIKRPSNLSINLSPIYDTIKFCLKNKFIEYDKFLLLQPTSPLRNYRHINESIKLFEKNDSLSCVSATKIKKSKENFYKIDKNNYLVLNNSSNFLTNRQKLDKYYEINGAIYISFIDIYLKLKTFKTNKTITYLMENKYSFDIDNKFDFEVAEYIFQKSKYD